MIGNNEYIKRGLTIYKNKLVTGKYDHYDRCARDILLDDCINQAYNMALINSGGKLRKSV